MKRIGHFLLRKVPEIFLPLIVGVLLYVWNIPNVWIAVAVVGCGLVLTLYDHESVPKGGKRMVQLLRLGAYEIIMLVTIITALVLWNASLNVGTLVLCFGFFVILMLNSRPFYRSVMHGLGDILTNHKVGALLAIVLVLLLMWSFTWGNIFFILLFLSFLLYRWESRVIAALALAFLAMCPILLSFNSDWGDAAAQQMAVWAYLLLVITVALQAIDLFIARKNV